MEKADQFDRGELEEFVKKNIDCMRYVSTMPGTTSDSIGVGIIWNETSQTWTEA